MTVKKLMGPDKYSFIAVMMTEGFLEVVALRQTEILCRTLRLDNVRGGEIAQLRGMYVGCRCRNGYECNRLAVNGGEPHVLLGKEEQAVGIGVKVSCKGVWRNAFKALRVVTQ